MVHIAISEGRYGKVALANESRTRDAVLARFTSPERLGDVIDENRLARATLLMQDVSGTTGASATVSPGTAPGTSDLTLQVPPAPPLSGSVQVDNFGETSTGTARIIGALNWNNPLGLGDQLGARVLTSITGQTYGNLGYTLPLGGTGLAWGVAYTRSTYVVGGQFSSLDAHGSANVVSTFFSYPLLRSVNANVFATLGLDHKLLADNLGAFGSSDDKNSDVGHFGLSGNLNLAKSISTFDASVQQGNLRIDDPTPQQSAAQSVAQTAGAFTKLVYAFTHTQALTDTTQVYVALNGQFTSRNLDSSEQMSLGGPYAVRAYATGDGALDEGYVATLRTAAVDPADARARALHAVRLHRYRRRQARGPSVRAGHQSPEAVGRRGRRIARRAGQLFADGVVCAYARLRAADARHRSREPLLAHAG